MKYENKEAFEQVNMFGTGTANTAYAQFFIGDSFLNPLTAPKGGLFVWARLTGADGQLANGNELAKRAIDKGVAFVPGTPFYATNPEHATLRLSFATVGPDKIVEGVGRLAAALKASA